MSDARQVPVQPASATSAIQNPTRVRHVVLAVTVAVYMITYMDRSLMSTALPAIREDLGISLLTASSFITAFRLSYSLFQIPGAWLGDKIGPRRALTLIVGWWSAFTALTGLAWNATVMYWTQFFFGMGEAGAFPIATRSLSRWMLPRERGYAQGVTHAGSRLGAAFTRPLAAALIVSFGWRMPFFAFAVLGLLWAVLWFVYYRDSPEEHKGVNAAERELIQAGTGVRRATGTGKVPWRQILASPTMQMLCIMYVCYQYGLAVYLDWFPTYLKEQRGMSLTQMGWYSSLPLLAGVVGNLAGGWLTDLLYHRTGNVTRARRLVGIGGFLLAGAAIVPATLVGDPRVCVAFSCLAFGALEMTIGASWAIPLDIGGDYAGSAAALMNTCGNLGGAISPTVIAFLVTKFGWSVPFMVGVGMNVVAALIWTRIDASKKSQEYSKFMLSQADNQLLTQTGAGTPMGDLLRRYWMPIGAETEFDAVNIKPVRLLGEDLTLYKDLSGNYGLVDRQCAHRRADMSYGFVEQCGLRCNYHGWLYDQEGRCMEQPYEDVAAPQARFRDKVRIKAYPVQAHAGLVWAYLGPQPVPLLPNWEPFTWKNGFVQIVFANVPCNWFQAQENSIDPVHFEWMHMNWSVRLRGDTGPYSPKHTKVAFGEFDHGFTYRRIREGMGEEDPLWTIGRVALWPNALFTGGHFEWRVPVDDENMLSVMWCFNRVPVEREPYVQERIPAWHGPVKQADGRWISSHIMNQDFVAWAGQGTIADRTQEHLGSSDRGILMMRKRFLDDLEAVARGEDPKAVIRDPDLNRCVPLPVADRKILTEGLTLEEFKKHPLFGPQFTKGYLFQAGQPEAVTRAFEEAMGLRG